MTVVIEVKLQDEKVLLQVPKKTSKAGKSADFKDDLKSLEDVIGAICPARSNVPGQKLLSTSGAGPER